MTQVFFRRSPRLDHILSVSAVYLTDSHFFGAFLWTAHMGSYVSDRLIESVGLGERN